MAIATEGVKEKIELMLEELKIAKASLENQQNTLEIKKEFEQLQENLEGLHLKIEQEEDDEYRLQQGEQQELLNETNQNLAEQQQQTKEEVQRAVKSVAPSTLPTKILTKREALEIKHQFQNMQNLKGKKSSQEFEHSEWHIDDEITHVKPNYNKNLGAKKEQEGSDSLSYPKTLKESLLSNKQIIEYSNNSSMYNKENLFSSSPNISPIPTPGNQRREEEEKGYSTYTTSLRA